MLKTAFIISRSIKSTLLLPRVVRKVARLQAASPELKACVQEIRDTLQPTITGTPPARRHKNPIFTYPLIYA